MYLPEAVTILNCSGGNMATLSREDGKFLLLVSKGARVLARGGGNFDLFLCKYERVVHRGVASVSC